MLEVRAEIKKYFRSFFGSNEDIQKSLWNHLTFNMHVFFLHNNLHSTTNKTCFLYARVVLTSSFQRPETRCEVLWNFSMVMSGWQVTSQVTSTYYYGIKLHQSCTVYCAVWCIDLYTKAQKVHGRAGSSEGLKIWRGNRFFFHQKENFCYYG